MRLACCSQMIPETSLTAKAKKAREWGLQEISLFIEHDRWEPSLRRELLGLEQNTGVRPCEFVLVGAVYGHMMDEDPEIRRRCRAMYRESAQVCAELGAVAEIEFEYLTQDPLPLFEFDARLNDKQEQIFVECYQGLLQEVAGSEGHILIEPLNRYESRYVNTVAESLRLVGRVDSLNAGLLLDCFHMSIEERSIVDAIVDAGSHTKHVHLAENNRKMPGEGSLEWPAIFAALQDTGYDGTISFECSTSRSADAAVPKSVKFVRQLLAH